MDITIRKGENTDIKEIMRLLHQVNDVHAQGRPDLFIKGCSKYTEQELKEILRNPSTPVFVAVTDQGNLAGYCFCIEKDHSESHILRGVKTLYIDDLCVDEKFRGMHIGKTLYEFIRKFAKESGFYNLTLNVWCCNPDALKFYESLGMTPQKIGMEQLL